MEGTETFCNPKTATNFFDQFHSLFNSLKIRSSSSPVVLLGMIRLGITLSLCTLLLYQIANTTII